jgi:hypothetical protein
MKVFVKHLNTIVDVSESKAKRWVAAGYAEYADADKKDKQVKRSRK